MNLCFTATVLALLAVVITLYFVPDEENEPPPVLKSKRFSTPELEALVQWIVKHGGAIDDRVAIRSGPLGRGVFLDGKVVARDGNNKPTQLYSVPETVYLSTKTVFQQNSVMRPILADSVFHDWFQHDKIMLAVALLAERNAKNSFWRPYIDVLPTRYDDQALFWSDKELDELQSPSVVKQIRTSQNWLRGHHDKLMQLLERHPTLFPKHQSATIMDDFIWAYYTVTSRVFDTGRPGTEDTILGLVPLVDLLNHAFQSPTVKHTTTLLMPDNVAFFTGIPYQDGFMTKGTELTWQYDTDAAPSMKYFFAYGMLPPDNYTQGDYIVLRILLQGQDWLVDHDGRVDPAIFDDVTAEELGVKVNEAVNDFATTLEEDKAALASLEDKSARWVALVLRVRYKQIIHKLLTWLEDKDRETGELLSQGEERTPSHQALFILEIK